ncbi:type II CAAX endopeptidase family protein [Clostridium sp. 1001275B_160808_H3]|uniref:CPBP family intramembrane glutamic endopeptidase n=1 Tax=Clostridium sp. 1001275B_160808_H3 TaxID=2787110 RepID=UPI0018989A55|nr:type II CAAX endopeptidase family protein [Clostridium sp. 1001275B_160808_H3]
MKEKLKSFFAAVGYLFLTFGIQLIVSIVGGGIIGVIYAMNNLNELNGFNPEELTNKILGLTNYILLASSIITVLVFLLIYKIRKKNFKEELQIVKTAKVNLIIGITLGISAWLFNSGALSLVQEAGLFKDNFSMMENLLAPLNQGNIFIALLTVGIIAPFTEEFMFRGVIFKTLNKNISILWTIIIQALFFGIFHGNLIQGTYATLLGLVFGYITYKTKSLWPSIIMHMINNSIATLSPYILKNVPDLTSILIGFVVVGAIGLITSLYFVKKKNISYEDVTINFNDYRDLN